MDISPYVVDLPILIRGFLKDDILGFVETWDQLKSYDILKDFLIFS
jgi:hypothetical protein